MVVESTAFLGAFQSIQDATVFVLFALHRQTALLGTIGPRSGAINAPTAENCFILQGSCFSSR
jgi:hypothetical protein